MNKNSLLLIFVALFGLTINAQSISVNDPSDPETNYTAEEMIQNVLLSGNLDCVDVSLTNLAENPAGVTNLAERSWGYFKSDGANFPFEEGIILSSGHAVEAEGPNSSAATSGGSFSGWPGDMDLQTILNNEYNSSVSTNNATVFEFTFTSQLSYVSFDFIFASEEYEDSFECSDNYRDGFAFLISGPGINDTSGAPFGGENIAMVPNSNNVPVSTASIHTPDMDLCGHEIQNQNYFPLYYVSNSDPSNVEEHAAHEYDGRTISLTAMADIIPGETYTMKMVIADRGDSSLDSAVFLRAGSFDIGDVDLGGDILLESGEANCEGETLTLSSGNQVSGATHVWYKDGVEIEGETGSTLDVETTGTYRVEVYYSETCFATDEAIVEFFPNPELELGDDMVICPDSPITLDATPSNPDELSNISYTWFIDGVEQTETTSTFQAVTGGTYRVEVSGNECVTADEIVLNMVDFTVDLGDPISPCGVETYEIVPTIEGADASGATYMWSTGAQTETITVSENGNYWVDVTINGCTQRGTADLSFRERPAIDLGTDFSKCTEDIVTLNATPSNVTSGVTYTWYFNDLNNPISETTASIDVSEAGTYIVEVDNNGCIETDQVTIENYPIDNCVIPEGISPNGDEFNNCMDLQFLNDELGISSLKIFNRHGRVVFEQSNYVNEFCGQDNDGNELPTGTYYYVIELNNSNQVYNQVETGWVYINREN